MAKNKGEFFANKVLEYLLYGMMLYIPISIALIEIFFCAALFFFIIKKTINPDFNFLLNKGYLFLLLFILFCALSFLNSGVYLHTSIAALVLKWLEYIILFIIVDDTLRTAKARLQNIILFFLIIGLITGIDGIFQYLFKFDFMRLRALTLNDNRIMASFRSANDFAAYLVPVFLIAFVCFMGNCAKKYLKFSLALLVFLLGACLILTFSRGAWLALFSGIFLLILLFPGKPKVFIIFLGITAIFLLVPALRQRIFSGSDAFRFTMWHSALMMIKENPFLGKGLGTFMAYSTKYSANLGPYYAHNCFLQMWAESGVFSLMSFLLFTGYFFYNGIKKIKRNNDFMLLGLIVGTFGFLVNSFFDTNLYSVQLSFLFWFLMGLISSRIGKEVKNG